MKLGCELKRYINHKLHLANNSNYYMSGDVMHSLQYCASLLSLFRFPGNGLTDHDIARYVLQNEIYLRMIVPNENNKSYKSSCEKIETIISYSKEILKPKIK